MNLRDSLILEPLTDESRVQRVLYALALACFLFAIGGTVVVAIVAAF